MCESVQSRGIPPGELDKDVTCKFDCQARFFQEQICRLRPRIEASTYSNNFKSTYSPWEFHIGQEKHNV